MIFIVFHIYNVFLLYELKFSLPDLTGYRVSLKREKKQPSTANAGRRLVYHHHVDFLAIINNERMRNHIKNSTNMIISLIKSSEIVHLYTDLKLFSDEIYYFNTRFLYFVSFFLAHTYVKVFLLIYRDLYSEISFFWHFHAISG